MINREKLQEILTRYKNDFVNTDWWELEKFKWEAVKCFQDNWDIDAPDFADMLSRSLAKTYSLLASMSLYPRRMIKLFAKAAPEEIRAMFVALYDENRDVIERITEFKKQSAVILKKYGNGVANHYQHENPISVYLWLRYPDKYYIYKFGEAEATAKTLESSYRFIKGRYETNLSNFYGLYDEICTEIKNDAGLTALVKSRITDECYSDNEYKTLTTDIVFYISRVISKRANNNKNDNDEPETEESATSVLSDDSTRKVHYWIYAPGDNAKKWEEFYQAAIMGLGWDEIGDFSNYDTKEEMCTKMKAVYGDTSSYMNSSLATWQFYNDIKIGDVIFVKKGRSEILGRGVVLSDYEYDGTRDEYRSIRKVKWTHKGNWQLEWQTVLKTLTDITNYTEIVGKLNSLFTDDEAIIDDEPEESFSYSAYSKEKFLEEVYMTEADYDRLYDALKSKKNIILQGAPGVGKTFIAKRLAYSILGVKDEGKVEMVQFHQSYSYEDFIMGYRPHLNGFELTTGAFYDFCKKAEKDLDNPYFFIIDEINRGNLSKIFGELFMLIEKDKRGISLRLLYSNERFSIPQNVYLIGTMNTADRSLAMLDYALRRRFGFVEMKPGFDTDGFKKFQSELHSEKLDKLINCVKTLNEEIASDDSLGEGFCIGHSYFCDLKADDVTDRDLYSIIENELIPLVKEYWFDETDKVRKWSDNLRGTLN